MAKERPIEYIPTPYVLLQGNKDNGCRITNDRQYNRCDKCDKINFLV